MNPILLRYVGIALAAVIVSTGGSYLVTNNKKASPPPVTQSGTIPAIPAQPFPGEGIPAIPAIPAVPPDKAKDARANPKEPTISWIWPALIGAQIPLHINYTFNEVGAGKEASIIGTGFFSSRNNKIIWDSIAITEKISASPWGDGSLLRFTVPSNAKPGETHTVSVATPVGTSGAVKVKAVEYLEMEPTLCGISPSAGVPGTKVEVCLQKPRSSYQFTEEDYYMFLQVPASLIKSDAQGLVNVWIQKPLQKIGQELYEVQIPSEVVYCPNFIASALMGCIGAAASPTNTKIALPSGIYYAKVYYRYVFPYKTLYGVATEPGLPYYNDWDSQFVLTVQ